MELVNKVGLLRISEDRLNFEDYDVDKYIQHINKFGVEETWAQILNHVQTNGSDTFLNPRNFGELYEAGLAEIDKKDKKKSGQYYTPSDVSKLMATWLLDLDGLNVCDVGCGTGNLIISYLDLLKPEEVKSLLINKRIFLYDFDKIALTIAQYSIALLYGLEYLNNINTIYGDFLNSEVVLPDNSKVISNPPYAKYNDIPESWTNSEIQVKTKEYYSAFIEKIALSGLQSVILTPYSFLGGSKFQELRDLLSSYNGFIVAFDNIPGNIFNGRKHGIFNSNTANSVRAAITVIENKENVYGFKTTPLIRFKNSERDRLLDSNLLKGLLSKEYRITTLEDKMFPRCHIELESCMNTWKSKSNETLKEFVSNSKETDVIYMPNTCRYYTTASRKKLSRDGYITLNVENRDKFNYLYCLINSSFVYWWWRVYDGGITYPKGLLDSVPIFYDLLTYEDKEFFSEITDKMVEKESNFTTAKLNAGKIQENIKFPKKYRDVLNKKFLEILSCDSKISDFDLVHKNSFFDE